MPRLKAVAMLSLATTLFVPAAFAQNTNSAQPGTVNYIEGQATLNGQALPAQSRGNIVVGKGETIATANGKAEVLLTPGVFLRLGDNSAVTMVSPDLTRTEVQVDRGRAEVEVDQIYKQNNLLVDQGPAEAQLLKNGLYEFDATAGDMRVFDGKAAVSPSQTAKKWILVKDGREVALNGEPTKPQDFNRDQAANQDPLYQWSSLRSDYLGQANQDLAREYAGAGGIYPGWWWDPGLYAYTWLPGNGLFWSPFGIGFYSPAFFYGGGFAPYGFYRGGYVGGFRGGYPGGFHGAIAGGFHGGGGRR